MKSNPLKLPMVILKLLLRLEQTWIIMGELKLYFTAQEMELLSAKKNNSPASTTRVRAANNKKLT